MIYIITLIISAIFWTGIIWLQNIQGMGVAWRITVLIVLFVFGVMFIIAGILAPPEPRSVLLQLGAAYLTTIPICIAYTVYKNTRGW